MLFRSYDSSNNDHSKTMYDNFLSGATPWFEADYAKDPLRQSGSPGRLTTYYMGHIVRMTKISAEKLLMEAKIKDQLIWDKYAGKYLYTFDVQNVMDGPCKT